MLPTYGYSKDYGYPHVEADTDGLFHYIIVERGKELNRRTTESGELLYWIFSDVTFLMGCDYELKNRTEEQDSRRLMFRRQEDLLNMLDSVWQKKEHEEHQRILIRYPFLDSIQIENQ